METNGGPASEEQALGPASTNRSKKPRLSRKYRGLTCANCRAKKVTLIHRPYLIVNFVDMDDCC